MYQLNITLNVLPKSLNKTLSTNRWKRNRINNEWDLIIKNIVQSQLPPEPLVKARISLIRHSHRTLDYDGLVGSMKPVVDALVTAGVLIDDGWPVLGRWFVDQKFRPKKDGPLLEIEVIDQQCALF